MLAICYFQFIAHRFNGTQLSMRHLRWIPLKQVELEAGLKARFRKPWTHQNFTASETYPIDHRVRKPNRPKTAFGEH